MKEEKIEKTVQSIVSRIVGLRKAKGFSLENMADELGISVSAYYKIENQETKLSIDRVLHIQRILDVSLDKILNLKTDTVYNQNVKDNGVDSQGVDNLDQDNRKLFNQYINSLKEEITFLRNKVG